MKRSLIFLLAAGPFFVFGQRLDRPPALKSFQFVAPWPGRSGDMAFFQQGLAGNPVRLRSGIPVRIPVTAGFTIREMPPDRMRCLVPLRMPEQMPTSLRGNADPLPNAVNKP
jgi:hypothetical protein